MEQRTAEKRAAIEDTGDTEMIAASSKAEEIGEEETDAPSQALPEQQSLPVALPDADERIALLEAIIYVAEEPLTPQQIADGLGLPLEVVGTDLAELIGSFRSARRGIEVRQVAGGYKMFTKPEWHDGVRQFVKTLQPKLKLSMPALETLAVIAYKQPVTLPEIQAIRGVNAAGVIHTLLKHKLVANAGRKKVVGKPMMYRTTREFLVQFGLNDVSELPSLKELEELSRAAFGEEEPNLEQAEDERVVDEGDGAAEDAAESDEQDGAEQAEEAEQGSGEPGGEPEKPADPDAGAASGGTGSEAKP